MKNLHPAGLTLVASLLFGVAFLHPTVRAEAPNFECGYADAESWKAAIRDAVRQGKIADPSRRWLPTVHRTAAPASPDLPQCLTTAQIHLYEDTNQVLLTDYTFGEAMNLFIEAANDLMTVQGDNYDFIGVWINFTPDHTIGVAFYAGQENGTTGLGQGLFNDRLHNGVNGQNIEGFIGMWDINSTFYDPGFADPDAEFTRLVLGQEFQHRWAMFLPDLADGREIQGDDLSCGRSAHWNFKADGQGSSMEISEWVGSSPADLDAIFIFNRDTGGVWSYPDLYLMGYVSAAEMDSLQSELRYMDTDATCATPYNGNISTFTSADIIATAGARLPDSTTSQKHFRTGWIMIHLPLATPTPAELTKAIGIMQQHSDDWAFGTLGRGTMNNSLFDDCNCNTVPDADDINQGNSPDLDSNGIPDECQTPCADPQDTDADGVGDVCDNCLAIPNANQNDADSDGLGDACDNCKFHENVNQVDLDADGQGDLCDVNDGVIHLRFSAANRLDWEEEDGFTSWHVYRGDLDLLKSFNRYTQIPGQTPSSAQFCNLSNPLLQDGYVPAVGKVAHYLTTGVSGAVEGDLGTDSSGMTRLHANPCP